MTEIIIIDDSYGGTSRPEYDDDRWDRGDSFVEHSIKGYDNIEAAETSRKILDGFTGNHKDNDNDYSVTIFDNEFKPYRTTVPWLGYFENLQGVYVETLYLEKKHGR